MAAKWITVTEPSSKTSCYIFKKTFTLTEAPVSFYIRVSADTRYKLYINGNLYKGLRDHVDGVIDSTAFDILTATGKEQTRELFYYRAFRYIRVACDKKPAYIKLRAARYVYDYEKNAQNSGIGSFESSQPLHTDVWQISKNALECCTHETVVDCPFYEQQQYIMDGVLESLYGYRFSNDTSIQKKLLLDLSQSQNIDGLLDANYPNITTQTIPGFSLYFVFGVREYLRYTGDTAFAKKMIGVCHRMLDYFESTVTKDGLVSPEYGWNFLDWVHGWPRGVPTGGYDAPMTAYNLIYAAALNSASEVCDACDFSGLANDFRIRSEKIIRAVNTHCYDNEKGLYTDVVACETTASILPFGLSFRVQSRAMLLANSLCVHWNRRTLQSAASLWAIICCVHWKSWVATNSMPTESSPGGRSCWTTIVPPGVKIR